MIVTIFIQRSLRKVKKEIRNTLLWYDTKNKRMLQFHGGKLRYDYDPADRSTHVSVEPLYHTKKEMGDNSDDVNEWISQHSDDFSLDVISAGSSTFTISFDDEMEKEVTRSLDAAGFRYAFGRNHS